MFGIDFHASSKCGAKKIKHICSSSSAFSRSKNMLVKTTIHTIAFLVIWTFSSAFAQFTLVMEEADSTSASEPDLLLYDPSIPDLFPLPAYEKASKIRGPKLVDDRLTGLEGFESLTDGTGPTKGTNYIKLYIPHSPSTGASNCSYIYMDFGSSYHLRLWGCSTGKRFPTGCVLTWDLNDNSSWLEGVPQVLWDYITIRTVSTDGIMVQRLIIKHSSEEILDWYVNDWLDSPNDSHLGLAAKTLERKLATYSDPVQAAVHFGLRELGKTDGDKYGTSRRKV